MVQNILVTGGSGFIGSNLVDKLILAGNKVFVIDDLSTGLLQNQNSRAYYFNVDLCDYIKDPHALIEIIERNSISIVFHLAASADVNLSLNNPETVYTVNVLASISLVRACIKAKVSRFIFASTSAVYGEPSYLPVDEAHQTNPISPYGLTKLSFEQYIYYCSGSCDLKFTIFRLPNVYGFRQRPDLEGGVIAIYKALVDQKLDLKIYGDGNQTRDWVSVDDIVDAFVKVLSIEWKLEVLLLGSDTKTSINQLIDIFIKETGYSGNLIYSPAREGDIRHMVMKFEKAEKILNWAPTTSLKAGISRLFESS